MARVGHQEHGLAEVPQDGQGPLAARREALLLATKGAVAQVAQTVTFAVAIVWWRTLVERAGGNLDGVFPASFDNPQCELPIELATNAQALGRDLAALPIVEACAQLGHIYTHGLPEDLRAAQGIFYTPPPLVRRLLDKAERAGHDWLTGSAIDPSCGGGAFLTEAAARMVAAVGQADPAIVIAAIGARLKGWDLDPFACWLAQLVVEALLLPQVLASGKRLSRIAECKDSLKAFERHQGRFNLVMGNPAFGKVKKTKEMGRRFARSLYGHPNLYGMLTDVAVHLAHPKSGIIAYLTPTSYLGGQYFRALRTLLAQEAQPFSIDLVESRTDVFVDVLQEVALTCFQRGRTARRAACCVIHVAGDGLLLTDAGTFILPADSADPWIVPRAPQDACLVAKLAQMPTRLRHWGYKVSTGPLVWNRHKERLHASRAEGRYPVIWAEAVTPDGRFSLQASKANHCDRAWFAPGKANDPNLVRRGCVLAQRTTAKEQDRRLICAVMPETVIAEHGAVAVENHLNMFVPVSKRPKVSPETLAAFLSTEAADRVIRCINGSVALSASELEAMPLPSVDAVTAALNERDTERALRHLYGIVDGPSTDSAPR